MKHAAFVIATTAAAVLSVSVLAQSVPQINYDAVADLISLLSYGEVAGVATNSRGHLFVYARTGHAVATLGDERTFYHGGSRLFQFDQTGKFVKEIGQGVYAINFAQQVRVDPQDNIWIVDAGSNQVVKFDVDGRFQMVLGRKPENITLRPAHQRAHRVRRRHVARTRRPSRQTAAMQQRLDPSLNGHQQRADLVILSLMHTERHATTAIGREYPVQHERVNVHVEVQRRDACPDDAASRARPRR